MAPVCAADGWRLVVYRGTADASAPAADRAAMQLRHPASARASCRSAKDRHMTDIDRSRHRAAVNSGGGRTCRLLLDRGSRFAHGRRDARGSFTGRRAEVVVGDLPNRRRLRVVSGCRRIYFGMSVSAGYWKRRHLGWSPRESGGAVSHVADDRLQMRFRTPPRAVRAPARSVSRRSVVGLPVAPSGHDVPGELSSWPLGPCAPRPHRGSRSDGARPLRLRR